MTAKERTSKSVKEHQEQDTQVQTDPADTYTKIIRYLTTITGISLTLYIVYSTFQGPYQNFTVHRALFLFVMLLFVFLSTNALGNRVYQRSIDIALTILSALSLLYVVFNYEDLFGAAGAASLNEFQVGLGWILILLVLEAARRVSVPLCIVAAIAAAYTLFGNFLPGVLQHGGLSQGRFIYLSAFSADGIFGLGLAVASTYLFMFMLFGAAMQITGAGDAFMRLSNTLVGRYRGGAAKGSVLTSTALGSVVGSAIGNVVATGSFTIPLMKRTGFKRHQASAIETVASEGAQMIPPVMGAAAFIMVEMTGIPYSTIAIAAIIPAFLYYLSVFIVVDVLAANSELAGLPSNERPKFWVTLRYATPYLLPLVLLIYLLVVLKISVTMAGLIAIIATVISTQLLTKNKLKFGQFKDLVMKGVHGAAGITALIACIGLVQQAFVVTGLGSRLTEVLIPLTGGNEFALLFLAMIITVILGMGLPTPIAYILAAVFIGPALETAGFELLAIHLFLFYFAIKSGSTPPVALVAVVAAGIGGADPWKTAWASFYYSLPGFMVAFAFVYSPEILLVGDPFDIIVRLIITTIAIVAFTIAIIPYNIPTLGIIVRIILATASAIALTPNLLIASGGAVAATILLVVILLINRKTPITFTLLPKGKTNEEKEYTP